jgi:hypothetical protein
MRAAMKGWKCRAKVSAGPPAAKLTTMRMVLSAKDVSAACTAPAQNRAPAAASAQSERSNVIIFGPPI